MMFDIGMSVAIENPATFRGFQRVRGAQDALRVIFCPLSSFFFAVGTMACLSSNIGTKFSAARHNHILVGRKQPRAEKGGSRII